MLVEQLEPKTLCTTNINLKNSTSFNYFFNNLESRIRKKKGGGGGISFKKHHFIHGL